MKRLWIAAPLAAAALTLSACSGLGSGQSDQAPGTSEAVAPAPAGAVEDTAARGTESTDTQQNRDVVRTATVSLIVSQPEQSVTELQRIAVQADGYVQSIGSAGDVPPCTDGLPCPVEERADVTGEAGRSGSSQSMATGVTTVVLRVPAADYDAVMSDVRDLGELASLNVSAEDVTGQVVDLDARIAAQRESVARVRQLMKQATDLSEVVQIEKELTSRQSDLEALVAQRQQLGQAVALATITAVLVPQDQAAQLLPDEDHWWDAPWRAFVGSWQVLLVALAGLSPLIIVLALAGVVTAEIVRRRRRSRPGPADGEQPGAADA